MKPPIQESVCDRVSRKNLTQESTAISKSGTLSSPDVCAVSTPKQHRQPLRSEDRLAQTTEHDSRYAKIPVRSLRQRSIRHADAEREDLYLSFQALVNRLVHRYGDTPEQREELKAEIYYRFCILLRDYDTSRNVPLRPYMVCQLTASVYTFARQQRARKQREMPLELEMERVSPALTDNSSDQWDDAIQMQEISRSLPRVMQRLTQRQRQVVCWRYYEERSYEEIATELAVQPSTARSILRHGLHNMRRMLEETGYSAD